MVFMKVKKRSLLLFISLAGLVMVYFTNCAGDLEMSSGLNTLCISKDCYSSGSNKLAIAVDETLFLEEFDFNATSSGTRATTLNAYTEASQSGSGTPVINMCMVDIGGSCNDGGYVDNIIEWELLNSKKSCSLKSTWAEKQIIRIYHNESPPQAGAYKLNSKCVNGHFNLKVLYPCYIPNVSNDMPLLTKNFGYYWQGPRLMRLKIIGFDKDKIAYRSSKPYDAEITLNLPGTAASGEVCPE